MAMVTGIATVLMLLKVQSIMMQFSYVSMGARNLKKLGGQFLNGVSYMTSKGSAATKAVSSKADGMKKAGMMKSVETRAVNTGKMQAVRYTNKKGTAEITHTATPIKPKPTAKTGTTYEAPKVTITRIPASTPKNNSKDKTG
jgi:hypothetical protein